VVKDQSFRTELDKGTVEERQEVLKSAGYIFSKEEFETAALDVLESKERGKFTDLNDEELAGVFGDLFAENIPFFNPCTTRTFGHSLSCDHPKTRLPKRCTE